MTMTQPANEQFADLVRLLREAVRDLEPEPAATEISEAVFNARCRMRWAADTIESLASEVGRSREIESRAQAVKYQNQTKPRVHLPCDVAAYILEGEKYKGGI